MAKWNIENCRKRIRDSISQHSNLEVKPATGLPDLDCIPLEQARLVNGVHVYAELANAAALLRSDTTESERAHKRFLRFVHLFARAAHWALPSAGGAKIDLQNKRLHCVVVQPMEDETARCRSAVALAEVLRRLIDSANEIHEEITDAALAVGLESGQALAVRNGTRGDREPLFLGAAANRAAHLLSGGEGVRLGERAAGLLGQRPGSNVDSGLAAECVKQTGLDHKIEELLTQWKSDLRTTPLADFAFSSPRLPLAGVSLDELSPRNSRRAEVLSLFADIDGFSRFVAGAIASGKAKDAAVALHVIRKELRDALRDFGGRKIRYHGDCLQGVFAAGTGVTVEKSATTVDTVLLCGALHDAFGVVREELPSAQPLGLAVGAEVGPVSLTRLGVRGSMDRCAAGLAVLESERLQAACSAGMTAVGPRFLAWAPQAVKGLFDSAGRAAGLTYNQVHADLVVKKVLATETLLSAATAPTIILPRAHCRS